MTLKHWLTFSLLVGVTLCSYAVSAAEPTSAEVFERRILPIFKSPNPSSCTQCHLAGVDLKNYILPSHEKTFLSLRDQGIIDFDNPDDSKILHLIAMGGTNGVAGEGAALIGAKVRALELAAFAEWIRASARDPELRAAPRPAPGFETPRSGPRFRDNGIRWELLLRDGHVPAVCLSPKAGVNEFKMVLAIPAQRPSLPVLSWQTRMATAFSPRTLRRFPPCPSGPSGLD